MSMNDTDKWASGIINELFEEDISCGGNSKVTEAIGNKENNENKASERTPDKDLTANEYEFAEAEFDAMLLPSDESINTNEGICETLHIENISNSSCNNQNYSIITNTEDIMSSCKTSDNEPEKLLVINKTLKYFSNTPEIGTLRETLNNVLTLFKNIAHENHTENNNYLATENLQISNTDSASSNSLTSHFVLGISDVKENEIEDEIDGLLSLILEIKQYYEEGKIKIERTSKNFTEFLGPERKNNELKELKDPSPTDLFSENRTECFFQEEPTFCLDEYDSTSKARNDDASNQNPEDEIVNNLKNLNVKERKILMQGDSKFEDEDKDRKLHTTGDTNVCDELSQKVKKENNINEDLHFKKRNRKLVEEYQRGFDSSYENSGNIISEGNISRDLVVKDIMESEYFVPDESKYTSVKDSFIKENGNSLHSAYWKRKIIVDENSADEVVHQRTVKMIKLYRNTCEIIEELFIRLCAILIAESADLLFFIFYLSICILYILYEKFFEKMSRRHSDRREKRFDGMSRGGNDVAIDRGESFDLFSDFAECGTNTKKETPESEKHADDFTSKISTNNSNQAYDSCTVLSVGSKDVIILDSVFEMVDLHFKNMYVKGEYIELCEEKKVASEVKLHENAVVDIVFKAYEGNTEDIREENEFDTEIIASSLKSECKLNESLQSDLSRLSPRFSQSFQMLSTEFIKNMEFKLQTTVISKNSNVKMFPNKYEGDERLILNSTEMDDSVFITRKKSRSSNDLKHLSSSEGNIVEVSASNVCFEISKEQMVSGSSMNVNVSSFSSRSDMDLQASSLSSLLDKAKEVSFEKWCSTPSKEGKMPKQLEITHGDIKESLINLNSVSSESFENNEEIGESRFSAIQKFEETTPELPVKSFMSISTINMNDSFQSSSKYFEDSPNFSTASSSHRNVHTITRYNSIQGKNAELLPKISIAETSTKFEPFTETKVIPAGNNKGQKEKNSGGLRRRMSLILNNFKNMQVMHCVSANARKKYKKHLEST